ncbi:MAG: AbrB family transcriptional regulator [Paenibacillaceae bacterium]
MIEARSKISSKGQVVIPFEIRSLLNIEEGDDAKFIMSDNGDLKLDIVKRNAILDLYGSLKPEKSDLRDFSEIREQSQKMKLDDYLRKGEE